MVGQVALAAGATWPAATRRPLPAWPDREWRRIRQRPYVGGVGEKLQHAWASATICLTISPLAFLGGGALLLGAVQEIYGDYDATCGTAASDCSSPRGWVVIALTAAGVVLFALGTATWLRAFRLFGQRRRGSQTIA